MTLTMLTIIIMDMIMMINIIMMILMNIIIMMIIIIIQIIQIIQIMRKQPQYINIKKFLNMTQKISSNMMKNTIKEIETSL